MIDPDMLLPLAALRKLSKYATKASLANAIGVHPSNVTHWETGIRIPSLPVAAKYAEELGVTLDQLFSAIERNGNDIERGRSARTVAQQKEN